jgi:hypothetical protein
MGTYNLDEIRARLKDTSESWVACIYLFGSIFRWLSGTGRVLAAILESPEALIELKYQTYWKL